jgi:peptide/nickel transport system substrate-binding protein
LVLVRNPWFREWSAAAQPDGYPDKIVLTFKDARGRQLTAVEHGRSDLMISPPTARLGEVNSRYAAQVHVFQGATTFGFFLNTNVAPFNSLSARKAFNYAFDRERAIAAYGGVDAATVTCQILPAGMPGYRPYCPYTQHPTGSGAWNGTDLARARKLVIASGTLGQRVVVWTGSHPYQRAIGPLAVATLNQIGYRASLRVKGEDYWKKISDSRTRAQTGFAAWQADFPAASNFLQLFTCGAFQRASPSNPNAAQVCDRQLDNAVDSALVLQHTDVPAANAAWAAIDRRITDMAAWVPLVNLRAVVVVSRRVGNVQSNPGWGILLGQMWVR